MTRSILATLAALALAGCASDGAPSVGFNIAPESRDLMWDMLGHNRDRAVVNPGRHGFQPRLFGKPNHGFGMRIRCDIDIGYRFRQKRVANAAADEQRCVTGARQHPAHRLGGGVADPIAIDLRHAISLSARPRKMRAVAPQM